MSWGTEAQTKLAIIYSLPAGELAGWWRYVHGWRAPFDGEIAALTARAQRLGVTLPLSSPGAPSGRATAVPPPLPDTNAST